MMRFWLTQNIGLKILALFLATLIWLMIHHRLPPVSVQATPVDTSQELSPASP